MSNLIHGNFALDTLLQINAKLNEETKNYVEALDNSNYEKYSPFMCFKFQNPSYNLSKLLDINYKKGELITDQNSLNLLHHFLQAEGNILTTGMPVEYSEWPIMTEIKSTRNDAISSFKEGQALLSKSEFLNTLYYNLIEFVIPLNREKPSGFDSRFLKGVIFRTFPVGRTGLLAGFQLAHGLGHHVALMLESIDPIFDKGKFEQIEYDVRNDKRTAHHAFVSSVALAYMAILAKDIYGEGNNYYIADDHIRGYSEYLPGSVSLAINSLKRSSCTFTRLGHKIIDEIEALGNI